jgi:hypothetical protein
MLDIEFGATHFEVQPGQLPHLESPQTPSRLAQLNISGQEFFKRVSCGDHMSGLEISTCASRTAASFRELWGQINIQINQATGQVYKSSLPLVSYPCQPLEWWHKTNRSSTGWPTCSCMQGLAPSVLDFC